MEYLQKHTYSFFRGYEDMMDLPEENTASSDLLHRLDKSRWNQNHSKLFAMLFITLVIDYSKPDTVGFVIPGMVLMWELDGYWKYALALFAMTGTTLGALVFGWLGDKIGRRPTLIVAVFIYGITSLCGASQEYYQSLMACFFMGFGVGGAAPLSFAIMSEYAPKKWRSISIVTLGITATTGGYIFSGCLAVASEAIWDPMDAWRAQWLVGIFISLILVVFIAQVMPESVRFLLHKGKMTVAREIVDRFLMDCSDPGAEKLPDVKETSDKLIVRTIVFSIYYFCVNFVYTSFTALFPTFVLMFKIKTLTPPMILTLSSLVCLPGLPLTLFLYYRWSPRKMMVLYKSVVLIVLLILGLLQHYKKLNTGALIVLIGIIMFGLFSIIGSISPYLSELFPTSIRSQRTGFATSFGRLGGLTGIVFGSTALLQGWEILWLLVTYAILLGIGCVIMFFFGIETVRQSLEGINRDQKVTVGEEIDLDTLEPEKEN